MLHSKIVILSLIGFTALLSAAPGCMDNSYRLTHPNDPKDYVYVACNCPCEKRYAIKDRKSTCCKCGHFRDPRFLAKLIKDKPMTCPKNFYDYSCRQHGDSPGCQ